MQERLGGFSCSAAEPCGAAAGGGLGAPSEQPKYGGYCPGDRGDASQLGLVRENSLNLEPGVEVAG